MVTKMDKLLSRFIILQEEQAGIRDELKTLDLRYRSLQNLVKDLVEQREIGNFRKV